MHKIDDPWALRPEGMPSPADLLESMEALTHEYWLEGNPADGYEERMQSAKRMALKELAEHIVAKVAPAGLRPVHIELTEQRAKELAVAVLSPSVRPVKLFTHGFHRLEVSQIVRGGLVHVQFWPQAGRKVDPNED